MSDQPDPTPIEITSPPPKEKGEEGNVATDKDYFYLYSNGKWIRVPIAQF
jgi:hypothetical protein